MVRTEAPNKGAKSLGFYSGIWEACGKQRMGAHASCLLSEYRPFCALGQTKG